MDTMNESQIVADSAPASVSLDGWGLDRLMDITELAAYLGVPVSTVYDWRTHGKGPVAYRFGKHLKFAVADVRAWVAEQRESA
ncbi:helix-turn-helix domain-containing protein [Agromyces endophyticus]|uniref:helix-turn-helix transcriptional regulator n=1 Tax=Agromyces sp. H17E-10 TaxID=2932244 RepID=UPI001FD57746|nr:helix-turn-helix domain-containing protein [Agromyces sp. H17E-10]UOQ89484.1 helix-turn-helix domain-containing protein [Agromyces sp. H17E-10]